MKIGKFLDHMDKVYHHHNHGPFGWVFCDLLDYYYGQSAKSLFKERWGRGLGGPPRAVFLLGPMAMVKFANGRVKWDYSKAVRRTPPQEL
jgi:hypothetical protein